MRLRTVAGALVAFGFMWGASPVLSFAASAHLHSHAQSAVNVLNIINHDRHAYGLTPLRLDVALDRAALGHSIDMAQRGYFSHTAPDGTSPFVRILRAGATYRVAGENIGTDAGRPRPLMLKAIEVAMLNSPEHRANLLRTTFTRIGIGVVTVGKTVFVTEDFAG